MTCNQKRIFMIILRSIVSIGLLTPLIVRYYVPPKSQFTKDFIKDLLANKKSLIKMVDIRMIAVPQYQELGVCKIWKQVNEDEDLMRFFCDSYADGKYPDRTYFYNVLNTVHPSYVS